MPNKKKTDPERLQQRPRTGNLQHGRFARQSRNFESQASELQTYRRKTEFNAKKAIQGHSRSRVFGDKGLSNTKY